MRWLRGCAAILGALLLASGCERSPQQELEQARKNLEETRQDVDKQIARLRAEAAQRTEQVQRDLQRDIAQQHERIEVAERKLNQEKRESAIHLQQTSGAPVATIDNAGAVVGQLMSQDKDSVTIRDPNGQVHELTMDARTRVMHNEQPVSLQIYAEGASVRASYIVEGEQKLARSVEILPGDSQQ
jgi:hypothetical protein